ncbi:MAG: nicotinate (nicotinamide) nucleotide adenylyltransferase [Candidatus Cloacimonadota bacterium]|nr:nicotinate (nicotinamide) nucleotide adenylyltransferase [Candidatus Cloacimonadota bacterium]
MKIGLLGGSFNPVHNGHLTLAQAALQKLQLHQVWFVPSQNNPLKPIDNKLSYQFRCELLQTALKNFPNFKISYADNTGDQPSYSDQLIKKLQQKYPQHQFYFIIGSDILPELPQWHNWPWLQQNVNFAVANRPGYQQKTSLKANLTFFKMPPTAVSASQIRQKMKKGESLTGLVPQAVAKKLYEKL